MPQAPQPKATRHQTPLIAVADALDQLLAATSRLETERIPLRAAHGRVLASAATADSDQPAYDRAMMDGFSVRSVDCGSAGAVLQAVASAPAGHPTSVVIEPGQCARIMTGGVVPSGADAVIAIEDVECVSGSVDALTSSRWRIDVGAFAGKHIARKGAECQRGDVVVPARTLLTPHRIGVLAQFGHTEVDVYQAPRVAIVPTGSELVAIGAKPSSGQVRNSNAELLAAAVVRYGGQPTVHEPVRDTDKDHTDAFRSALADADILVTSGGVSMGDYDLVAATLEALGARVVFHRICLKPGKPLLCAVLDGKLILGLPGNPVSGAVCAELFLRPAIARLQGSQRSKHLRIRVQLGTNAPSVGGRDTVYPAKWSSTDAGAVVEILRTSGSADIAAFAQHDALVYRAANSPELAAGAHVEVLHWPDA